MQRRSGVYYRSSGNQNGSSDLRSPAAVRLRLVRRNRWLRALRMIQQPSHKQVVLPMIGPDRRRTPRTTMERHAYINIEPNNGGIVLNVSGGGLCFHSLDPVQRNGTIRFWFSDHNRRIEADGELAWTDETQKGGLRFTALPEEAREQIRNWMSQPTTPPAADQGDAPSVPPTRAFPILSASRPDTQAAPVGSAPLAMVSTGVKVPIPLSAFSRGLATGLTVSAIVALAFLFHVYRSQFGETLIQLGERFAAKPQAQTLAVSAAPQTMLPAPQTVSPAQVAPPAPQTVSAVPQGVPPAPRTVSAALQTVLPAPQTVPPKREVAASVSTPIPVPQPEKVLPQPEKLAPQPLANPARPQQAKLEPAGLATASPTAAGDPAPKVPGTPAAPAISLTPPAISLPTAGVAPDSNLTPGKLSTVAKVEPANQPGVHTEGSTAENANATSEMFFEVGRFKNPLQAHDETDKLAQLGFPATAVQKGHLWANSYRVLVGPYGDEDRAKATHQNLVADGFKARPFERGSRNFTLLSSLTLNGERAPEGDYTISWESYVTDAAVKFTHNNYVIATADGRWVKHNVKYQRDAYVYRKNIDGSRTLLEIHFGGMRQALVFGKSS
jgi:hypothetical protein